MPPVPANLSSCRADFPALNRTHRGRPLVYLDGPAGTQVPTVVIDAIAEYYKRCNANSHGEFPTSRESDLVVGEARERVAAFLGAKNWRSVSFGANMTTLAFALSHALARDVEPGDEVVVTQLDHEANRAPWMALASQGARVREVRLLPDGTLDSQHFEDLVGERTRIVAIGHASNALGTVNDLALARRLTRDVGALLIVDAVHSAPHLPIDVAVLDPDFLLCSCYKFYGPHVGVLYSRPGLLDTLETDRLRTQEPEAPFRMETGTLNHAALAGVRAAIDYIASWGEGATLREKVLTAMATIGVHERDLARRYAEAARELDTVTVWGPPFADGPRAPTVSITLEGLPATEVARRLGDEGIQVWDGHFYAIRAVEALGLVHSGGLVRTGISMYTIDEDVDRLLEALARVAEIA